MAITALTDVNELPNQSQPQEEFDAKWAAVIASLPLRAEQENALAASLTRIAAGGGFTIPYTFSTSTANGDPGNGFLRLNNATQNAATAFYADLVGADTATYTGMLDRMDDSSSIVKGQITLISEAAPSRWLSFEITALTSQAGYKTLTVTPVASSATNPFGPGESIVLTYTRSGDMGTGVTYLKVSDRKPDATTAGDSVATTISQTRTLNTVEHNSIAGASLAANQVTLPAGTYRYRARAPAYQVGFHRAFLYNVTDGTYIGLGSNAWAATNIMTDSNVSGEFVLASSKVLSLRHYTISATTNGLGAAGVSTGQSVVYAEIEFEKVV